MDFSDARDIHQLKTHSIKNISIFKKSQVSPKKAILMFEPAQKSACVTECIDSDFFSCKVLKKMLKFSYGTFSLFIIDMKCHWKQKNTRKVKIQMNHKSSLALFIWEMHVLFEIYTHTFFSSFVLLSVSLLVRMYTEEKKCRGVREQKKSICV